MTAIAQWGAQLRTWVSWLLPQVLPLQAAAHPFAWTIRFGISGFSAGLEHLTNQSMWKHPKGVHIFRDIKLKTNDDITGNYINPAMKKVQEEKQWFLHSCTYIILRTFESMFMSLYHICVFLWKKDILLHSYKTTKIHFSADTILIVSLVAQG